MTIEESLRGLYALLEGSQRTVVFFDTDTDGTTAYLQLKQAFSQQVKGFPFDKKESAEEELLNRVPTDTEVVVFLDVPSLRESLLSRLFEQKIVWVDHHPTNERELIERHGIYHINPLDYEEQDARPVSYWMYRLIGSQEGLFYATLGSVADFFLLDVIKDCHVFMPRRFALLFPKLSEEQREALFTFLKEDPLDEQLHRQRARWIQYLVYAAGMIRFKNFFDFLYKTDDDDEVLKALRAVEKLSPEELAAEVYEGKSPAFAQYHERQREYERVLSEALARVSGTYIIYEYTGDLGFTKTLSEELMYRLEGIEAVMIAYQKPSGETYHISLRSAGNLRVNEIAVEAAEGLDAQAGGHEFAAGGRIAAGDFPTFKARIAEAFAK